MNKAILKPNFLHNHIRLEIAKNIDDNHSIVDMEDWVIAREYFKELRINEGEEDTPNVKFKKWRT